MEQKGDNKRASLQDVLNYTPETYLTQEEIFIIKDHFKNNPRLLKVLRKVLMPTIADPELPIEEIGGDWFLAGRQWAQIPSEEVKTLAVARQDAIQFIVGGLIKLKVIANQSEPTDIEESYKRSKDGNK